LIDLGDPGRADPLNRLDEAGGADLEHQKKPVAFGTCGAGSAERIENGVLDQPVIALRQRRQLRRCRSQGLTRFAKQDERILGHEPRVKTGSREQPQKGFVRRPLACYRAGDPVICDALVIKRFPSRHVALAIQCGDERWDGMSKASEDAECRVWAEVGMEVMYQ
jgi:hypothetical protein